MTAPATPAPAKAAPVYGDVAEWVENYFVHVVAGPYDRSATAGGRTWCPQWWAHPAVVLELDALWRAWEDAKKSGGSAMSSWWVNHLMPHVRWMTDAENGPMTRCDSNRHDPTSNALTVSYPPADWFDRQLP